jgi:hypothetical protein
MIIKDDTAFDRGIQDVRFEDDQLIVDHVQDLDPIYADLKLRKENQHEGGFSKNRNQRFIGTVPMSVFALHPEFLTDTKALMNWLANDPVGQTFCVNKPNTGRSGKVIIK